MVRDLIVFLLLFGWLWTLLGRGSYRRTLPCAYRRQNIALSFVLVAWASVDISAFWWSIFHPDTMAGFFASGSGFPPGLGVIIAALAVCAAHLQALVGYWMVQQRKRARAVVLSVVPYLAVVEVLEGIRTSTKFRPEAANLGLLVFAPLVVAFYVWLYLFCKSKQAEELMANVA